MSYVDTGLKFMVGCIAGFVVGIATILIVSPVIYHDRFFIPIGIISIIGFPVLFCTRKTMKGLLITIGISVLLLGTILLFP